MDNAMISAPMRGIHYAARVVGLGTAKNMMMYQVDIPELFSGAEPALLPWGTLLLSVGARENEGDFTPLEKDDWVWVDFPYVSHGEIDTRRPRIVGSMHTSPNQVPNMPHEVFGGSEKLVHKRTSDEPKPATLQPGEAKVSTFGNITVEQEKEGVLRVTNRKTGTAFEVSEAIVSHSEGKQFISSKDTTQVESGKALTIKVLQGGAVVDADTIDLGKDGALQPSVLGDMLAAFMAEFKVLLENHIHIGNLGAPTSTLLAAMGPWDFTKILQGGDVYSKKNRNQ